MIDQKDSGKLNTKWGIVLVLILIIAGGSLYAAKTADFGQDQTALINEPFFEVKTGPLTISVSESGTIQAKEMVILKSEVEGRSTILSLVPEGTEVKKGDLLVELDASSMVDQSIAQKIAVQNATAAYVRARENLAVVENQAKSDVELAELNLQFAKEDLSKYRDGEYPKLLKEAQSKITLASETLVKATEDLKWSRILFDKKYLSQTKLQEQELTAHKAKTDLELAKADLDLLVDYTYQRQINQLESDFNQAEMAFEREQRKARASVIDASADLYAKEAQLLQETSRLKKLEEQIQKAKIFAPTDGLVIYASSAKSNRRGNEEPLAEGQEVHEREELIYLPTTSSVKAEIKLHESNLDKVSLGLPARVTLDAVPGKEYLAKVTKISPLPDAQSVWLNPDLKVYTTEVDINGDAEELRTGMSCRVEILIDHYNQAKYVPIQSVIRVDGEPTVYVHQGDSFQPKKIETGLDNNRMIHVLAGLSDGEKVWLTPPLKVGGKAEGERANGISEQESELLKNAGEQQAGSEPSARENRSRGGEQTGPPGEGERRERPRGEGGRGGDQPGGGMGGGDRQRAEGQGGPGGPGGGPGNIDPERAQAMRERFQNMSPEERENMRKQWEARRQGQG
ncbi:MAG: HlyD family efflux transporter periplasmic adaptor subunit [Candidatus Omnitrophica bacterium]|nr:HlyD family efflux transporter periplasmic adaptor subunit [Candidatus Omnitrophota bacterium]